MPPTPPHYPSSQAPGPPRELYYRNKDSPNATALHSQAHRGYHTIPRVQRSHTSRSQSPISTKGTTQQRDTHDADMMAVSTTRNPASSFRLPSFAELNERLNFRDTSLHGPLREDRRHSGSYATGSSEHSSYYLPREHTSSYLLTSTSDNTKSASSTPLLDADHFDSGRHRSATEVRRPSAGASGLTASWLPVEDPGRSLSGRGSSRGGTTTASLSRRSTVSQGDPPSQHPHLSWYSTSIPAPSSSATTSSRASPSWESSRSTKAPSGLSLPTSSTSSPTGHRYHPFARDSSLSPDHHRLSSMSANSDYIGHAACVPRRRGKLPKDVTELLKGWLMEHSSHPYPNEDEKRRLCVATGLSISQVSNWFINARRRILVPQQSAAAAAASASAASSPHRPMATTPTQETATGHHSAGSSLGQPSPLSATNEDDYFHSHYHYSNAGRSHPQHSQNSQHSHHHPHYHSPGSSQPPARPHLAPLRDAGQRHPQHPHQAHPRKY